MTSYEIATRVPVIIAAPGFDPARTVNLSELVDLYLTLCELAGLPGPDHLEGDSLVPALREPELDFGWKARSEYVRFNQRFLGRALHTDCYRYVIWTERTTGKEVARELYDHALDPYETQTRAGDLGLSKIVSALHLKPLAGD